MTSVLTTQMVSIAISFQDVASHTHAPGHSLATLGVASPQEHCPTKHANGHVNTA